MRNLAFAVALATLTLAPAAALAHRAPHAAVAAPPRAPTRLDVGADAAAESYFTNLEVVDQHGRPHRFYRDLMRGKIVVLNFVFTSCTSVCSPVSQNLARVQAKLGKRMETEVRMISVTVDPSNDTPAALRRFAAKFGAGSGWYFLTGSRENVTALLRKLGGYTDDPDAHSTALVIGDPTTGNWVKTFAMDRPDRIVEAITHLNDA